MKKFDFYEPLIEPRDIQRLKLKEGIEIQKEIDSLSFNGRDSFGYVKNYRDYHYEK